MSDFDDLGYAILSNRGGCRCSDPGAHPPCWNCESPWKLFEVMDGLFTLQDGGLPEANMLELQAELVKEGYTTRNEMLEIQQRLIDEG